MVIPNKISTLLVLAFASLLLVFAPMAGAAINTGLPSYDNLMQAELDSLMEQVAGQFENTAGYLEKAEFYSVLEKGLAGQGNIKTAYEAAIQAQNNADADKNNPELQDLARVAMDDLFLAVLYQIQLNKALATTDQEITTKLIDILEGRGEGFSERPGFILDPLSGREGNDLLPEEDDPNDDPEDPKEGFLFYGKAYNLETDVDPSRSTNGILYFTDDKFKISATIPDEESNIPANIKISYPPAAMPLLMHQLPRYQPEGEGGLSDYLKMLAGSPEFRKDFIFTVDGVNTTFDQFEHAIEIPGTNLSIEYVPQEIFKAPEVTKNDAFYRYTWDTLAEEEEDDSYLNDFNDGPTGETDEKLDIEKSPGKIPPFSTTLYQKSNIISHVYSANQVADAPPHVLFTGLTPGDGAAGQPGAGLPRGIVLRLNEMYGFGKPLNLSNETGSPFFNTEDEYEDWLIQLGGDAPSNLQDFVVVVNEDGYNILLNENGDKPGEGEAYLTIGEVFISLGQLGEGDLNDLQIEGNEINPEFDLSEQFVVFIPDSTEGFSEPDEGIGNQYTVHTGNPFMVVDRSRHNYDEDYDDGISSLDEAIMHISDNPGTLNDDFRWDFQVNYTGSTKDKLSASNFLAYAVQVEEDIVNEKILEMRFETQADVIGTIRGLRDYKNIRDRDAWFESNADAKAGRVMKDIHGNWVRVQQYILSDVDQNLPATTVKILNVSLREAGNNLSGMSTIDFTTVFDTTEHKINNIQILPWGKYLTTHYDDNDKKYISHESLIGVNSMSVKFTNPGNEYLSEVRNFATWEEGRQNVTTETLTLHSPFKVDPEPLVNDFTGEGSDYKYIANFSGSSVGGGYYQSDDRFLNGGDTKIIGVGIHRVEDTPDESIVGTGDAGVSDEYVDVFKPLDIWAVLGAGQGEKTLSVASGNSIEIVMDQNGDFFDKPIDTIFIPMQHMRWDEKYDVL